MKKSYHYIKFELSQATVDIWIVRNKKLGDILGNVLWAKRWKQWVFMPNEVHRPIFSVACMKDTIDFIGQLEPMSEKDQEVMFDV